MKKRTEWKNDKWHTLNADTQILWVPDGWLVRTFAWRYEVDEPCGVALCHYPDPKHEWLKRIEVSDDD